MDKIFLEGTIELMVSLFITGVIVFKFGNHLRLKKAYWYLGAGVLSFASTVMAVLVFLNVLDVSFSIWWVRMIRGIISGYLPASIFIFVMYGGVLNHGHVYKKPLMSIRTELSLIGVILYLPHTLLYAVFSAPYGISALLAGEINLAAQIMTWTGLINAVLLIILGVTSINKIKLKMGFDKWKKLHKWSYLFYFNACLHYLTLSLWGQHYERVIIYCIIYGTYAVLKAKKMMARPYQVA